MCTGLWRRVLLLAALPNLLLFVGSACSPASAVNTVLNQQVSEVLGSIPEYLIVRVVNQTNNDVQLDILVDGLQQTVTCSSLVQVCDLVLTDCPQVIQAAEQRSLDPQGRFVGGRIFNGNEAFTFRQGEEIQCDSVIVYKFTEGGAEAFDI